MTHSGHPFPDPPLCSQLGFSATKRAARVQLFRLGEADHALLRDIHEHAIVPNSESIMTRFYDYLQQFDAMRQYLGQAHNLPRLKRTQLEYLDSFGIDFDTAGYFEYRLRIGVAHERIGMPLHLYLAAYRHLQSLLIDALPHTPAISPAQHRQYSEAISKIVMLDMSLAIDTYTTIRIDSMTDSISALQYERDALSNQIMHDTLTGILSRHFVMASLNKQLSHARREAGYQVHVALLDLDRFKAINDNYGHAAGDLVLREFAQLAAHIVRDQDYFGRFGGEEFLLVTCGLSSDQAAEVVERIRLASEQHVYRSNQHIINMTVSCGLSMAQADDTADVLIQRADRAMYAAKEQGRNRLVIVECDTPARQEASPGHSGTAR